MKSVENELSVNEKITTGMIEDKDFCLSIVSCKDREEVKKFLVSKGIDANENDIDNLAENVSEIADIYKKLDDKELDKIAGGGLTPEECGHMAGKGSNVLGIGAIVATGLLVLTVAGAGIKKLGDKKGWWDKYRNKN